MNVKNIIESNETLSLVICNQPVAGSSPISSSKEFKGLGVFHLGLFYLWSLSWSLHFSFKILLIQT